MSEAHEGKALRHPFGYWKHPVDSPRRTVAEDKRHLEQLAKERPQLFQARPGKPPKDVELYNRILQRLEDDGHGPGSMDLRYVYLPVYGQIMQWAAQIIGSCVASGAMRAIAMRILWEILILGQLEEPLGTQLTGVDSIAPFGPYHYRAGRKKAGIDGNSDGSTCGGQIAGLMEYGILPCSASGLDADTDRYPEPSGSIYRRWGANDTLLNKYASQGKAFDLLESASPRDGDEAMKFVADGKPMMICSGWGFAPQSQHKDGFWIYKPSGSWSHNMTICIKRVASDGDVFAGILNSWGPGAHKDGEIFHVDMSTFERWLRDANVATIGELDLKDSVI